MILLKPTKLLHAVHGYVAVLQLAEQWIEAPQKEINYCQEATASMQVPYPPTLHRSIL